MGAEFRHSNILLGEHACLQRRGNFSAQGIQDAYISEAGLIEVVVGSEEEIGWVMAFSRSDYYLKAKYVPLVLAPMRKVYLTIKFK